MHRLVAQAFVPNPLGLPEIDHDDGDKANARAGNLVWSTRSSNMLGTHQRRITPHQRAAIHAAAAEPIVTIARNLGLSRATVRRHLGA